MYTFPSENQKPLIMTFNDPIYLIDNYYWNETADVELENINQIGFENLGNTTIDISFDKKNKHISIPAKERVTWLNVNLYKQVYFRCKDREGYIRVTEY